MNNSKQRRFAIGITSLLILSSCKPLLSSKGETHSPYQPTQKQNTQKTAGANGSTNSSGNGSAGGNSSGHGSGTSGTSGATGATGSATGPTGAPASNNKDLDRSLDEITKTEVLKVTFNGAYDFPYDKKDVGDFDSLGCRSLMVRGGMRPEKGKDDTHFSCQVRYCVYKTSDDEDTKYAFKIPQNTTFYFLNQNSDVNGDRTRHVRLHSVYSGDDVGSIDELQCDGMGGTLTVRDLIEAFGKASDGKQDAMNAQIASVASLFTPPAATGPQTPTVQAPAAQSPATTQNLLRLNGKKVGSNDIETKSARGLASVPAVSQTSRPERDKDRAKADLPNFALQLMGSVRAFGGSTISPAQEGTKSGAMVLQLEYQPSFLQHFGIFSIGPSFGTYPTLGSTQADEKVTPGFFAITGVGGQVRYQLHYFENQFVVPYASYEAQSLSYRINGGGSGRLTVAGGSGGLSLLLNRLAPGEAIDMKQNLGISRSYLVVEGKYLYGTDQNVQVSGTSVFFGLRFER